MTQPPSPGQPLVCQLEPVPGQSDPIFITELARYLEESPRTLLSYAKKRHWAKRARTFCGHPFVYYVTPYAAERIIAYIRAFQGEKILKGLDFRKARKRALACKARKAARILLEAREGEK